MNFLRVNCLGTVAVGGVMVAGLSLAATAQDKSTMPDAQVEANVLRQLAGAPELSTQNIQTTTVYGTVTLSGTVHDEALRTKAENLAARSEGVKKVVDQLTLGDSPVANDAAAAPASDPAVAANSGDPNMPAPGMVLQSDGTYAAPEQQATEQGEQANASEAQPGTPGYAPPGPGEQGANGYASNSAPADPSQRKPMYNGYAGMNGGPYAGQKAGIAVTVPAGAPLQVRINRGIDANEVKVGDTFDGTVMYDVVAKGAVAIPRGATVQGTVVEAKKAGTLKGRAELSLNLTSITLGGQVYPITSTVWDAHGRDKTTDTVNRSVGMGIFGAVVGAVVGGGKGAAIGAGVGAGAGVAESAGSPDGRVFLRPESTVNFNLAQPAALTTVSQQEMARLSYAAGPVPAPRPEHRRRYYSPGYGYYYGPGY